MDAAMRVISEWAFATAAELSNVPCDILVDNPTDQAYEIKSYHNIHESIQTYLEDLAFEELLDGLMGGP
tara:strand:+ start:5337 stop:5543 length:207 start_codon:yes stop_codon:yes gene_type:complete